MFLANSVCASDNGHGLTPAKQLRSRDPGLLCYCLGLVADLGTVNRHTVTFALGLSDYVPLNTTKPLAGLPPGQTPRAFLFTDWRREEKWRPGLRAHRAAIPSRVRRQWEKGATTRAACRRQSEGNLNRNVG
jgi:hypothetical protein